MHVYAGVVNQSFWNKSETKKKPEGQTVCIKYSWGQNVTYPKMMIVRLLLVKVKKDVSFEIL